MQHNPMPNGVRALIVLQIVAFVGAALVHAGVIVRGYEHAKAASAETVIAAVLLAGLSACAWRPHRWRLFAALAQGFALLGTLVGALMIAIGVGPQSVPDKVLHGLLIVLQATGLVATARLRDAPDLSAGHR